MILLDIDGCVADDAWRIQFIRWYTPDPFERYDMYHMMSIFDKAYIPPQVRDVPAHEIYILTAMPERYRAMRNMWLERNDLRFAHMLMRPNDDHQHSFALKAQMLDDLVTEYGVDLAQVTAAYDDREEIIQLYQSRGIPGKLLKLHDTCAYTNPLETKSERKDQAA